MSYRFFFKRVLDLFAGSILFIILFPVFLLVVILLFIVNDGQAFFIQPRPGRKGKIFHIIKFKTMKDTRDIAGNLLADEKRITAVGNLVRSSSLDEIPQLINVIKGDMSLVGPRPLLVEYLPLYSEFQKRRHEVRPGITGWAQINGRNAISWKQKFELDVWYVENLTFFLDIKIIFYTIFRVFKREGIAEEGQVTMSKFTGN